MMKRIVPFLFAVFFLSALANPLRAQWVQTNGPFGGAVSCFIVSGTNLFAGTSRGVFVSTNNGTSWVNTGLTDNGVFALAISGTNLFAGTGNGVFLSSNNGTTWTAVNTDLAGVWVEALAVSPDGATLFAGTYGGLFLSTNSGTSWTATGLTSGYVSALAVSGTNLFAGTGNGVFLSSNNGTTWTAVNAGLTTKYVQALAISPNGAKLFAGTYGGGVFLSTNNGTSWTAATTGLTYNDVIALAVSSNGANLFAGTSGGGVFLSTNNGTSWNAVNTGLADTYVLALAVSTNGANVFAGTQGGVFLSTNNGTSWNAVSTGLTYMKVEALAVSGTNLFAGTESGGVFLSTNNGTSWNAVNTGLTYKGVKALAISPNGANLFAGGLGGGVFLSTNFGASWTEVNYGLTHWWVTAFATSGKNLFAGTWSNGVYLSTNNGTSWVTTLVNQNVRALAVSDTNLFVGTGNGLFLSSNNGASWTKVNTGLYTDVTVLTTSGTNLFAGTYGGGIYLSTNNGTSWAAVNTGLTDKYVYSLAVSGSYLFAGTSRAVFLSANNGISWTDVSTGLTNTVKYFAVKPNGAGGTNVFAGTYVGVWRRPLSEMVSLFIAPIAPTLASPGDATTGVPVSTTLAWNAVTGATTYHLQLSSGPTFAAILVDDATLTATSKTVGPLSNNTTYFWRLSASNAGGASAWSSTRSFTTIMAPPSAPTLSAPIDSTINLPLSTTVSWSAVAGATVYHLQVSTSSSFSTNIFDDTTLTAPSKAIGPLSLASSYYWRVRAKNAGGFGAFSAVRSFKTIRTTSIEQLCNGIPMVYSLSQNYPNPFNPATTVQFGLPKGGQVSLKVFDLLGREVATLVSQELGAGYFTVRWQADVPSGTYIYRLQAGEFVETKKMILVR